MQETVVNKRYSIIHTLGRGGMAKVYLAHDEVLDRDVALKALREQFADDEEFVERFKREAQSAAALTHSHIVQVYDRGETEDGSSYIAMEYVPGGTLKERISSGGPLEPGVAASLALQIAEALSAAHERGVVHRDIKPQNVLLTATG
jgi:serine/threonine protein kinase